jgi:biopolymer transport protein ExbD
MPLRAAAVRRTEWPEPMPSKAARRVRRNHANYRGRHDINVVPMIDMMVILVFFLIFTAVFTKTNVLELNLPGAESAVPNLPQGLNLEVIIRRAGIDIADRGTGLLKQIPMAREQYDLVGLQDYLKLVKSKYPDKTEATILLEQDIKYETLVQVMDTVRVYAIPGQKWAWGELFTDVSVGDAPIEGAASP